MLAPAFGRARSDVGWAQTGSIKGRILAISRVRHREQSSNISAWGRGFLELQRNLNARQADQSTIGNCNLDCSTDVGARFGQVGSAIAAIRTSVLSHKFAK